jgi:Protein of unknown function (DUF1588)
MRRGTLRNSAWMVAAFGIAVSISACGSSEESPNSLGQNPAPGPTDPNNPNGNPTATPEEQVKQILDARKTDFGEAARTAKLKLNDELPTLEEINQIGAAADDAAKKVVYEGLVDKWMADPKFARTMVKFWKDTFRSGQVGAVQTGNPDLDKPALFAAQVVVMDRAYTDILTAGNNTCPTFDPATGVFTDGACPASATAGPTSGVLTSPALMAQYFSNMAFRRVRFIQETFACDKFPIEYATTPTPMGNGTYTSPWDFNRVVGKQNTPTARIDFQDTSAVICANCHTTMNGISSLFLNFDAKGVLQATSQVEVPIPGNPKARPEDYLTAGQPLAWRMGKTITDIPTLGQAMAADPVIAKCAVNRVWNYAMSRGDIVNDLATVPDAVTAPYVMSFTGGGMKLKETIRAVFKSEDFTKF